jgi:myo-inositol-1(or 4)-monophosphatase
MLDARSDAALDVDWLAACRRAEAAARAALEGFPATADRARTTGRGEGGDVALVIDRAAEDAILAELEALGVGLTAVSEERGEIPIGGGGPVHVIVDPIDGSRNAKRGIPTWSVSIAVATGDRLGDVRFAYVRDCVRGEEWWARAGEGAFHDDARIPPLDPEAGLEMVGLEFIHPGLVAEAAAGLAATGAERLRALGSIALTLCYVACGRLDGMVTLAGCRSVDIAAGQLIVREAGGVLAYPDDGPDPLRASLGLDWRSRVFAAAGPSALERLLTAG